MTIVIATRNFGKLNELTQILASEDIEFVSMADFNDLKTLLIEESGQSYQDNASLKAKIVAQATGLPSIADDSGLEVEALDKFPGVKSARWISGSDEERNRALLKKMTTTKNRAAQFKAVLCLYDPITHIESCVEGELKGHIAQHQAGSAGFGYDSIFIPQGYNQSLAELGLNTKLKISHRSIAAQKLSQLLKQKYDKL